MRLPKRKRKQKRFVYMVMEDMYVDGRGDTEGHGEQVMGVRSEDTKNEPKGKEKRKSIMQDSMSKNQ